MNDQAAATTEQAPRGDLERLVKWGATPDALKECVELANLVLRELDLQGTICSEGRSVLLQETLTGVIDQHRQDAFRRRAEFTQAKAIKTTCCKVAAAAELLGLTNDAVFEEFKQFRCNQIGETWLDLLEKDDNRGETAERQLCAALWLWTKSAKTGERRQPELLAALELAIPQYLKHKKEHLRLLAISYLEQPESTNRTTSPFTSSVSPTTLEQPLVAAGPAPKPALHSMDPKLTKILNDLASAVQQQWREEQRRRRENDPFLLQVRWKNSPKQYAAHWATVRGVPENNEEITLDGTLDEAAKTFESVPSKRLVVLGQGGAGKTTLAIELLLKLLSSAHLSAGDQVPMILNLASWNPVQQSLRDWITERIIADYQDLNATIKRHRTSAAQLVYADHVLPVLDGFDEIDLDLRTLAIQSLNIYTGKMVMTSRAQEYYDAIDAGDITLSRAAVIVLEDLTLHEISHYFPLTTRPLPDETPNRTKWDPVLKHMRSAPDNAHSATLLKVFATPLMVSLARRIYSDTPADPIELLDSTRFPNAATLSDYLFDQFIQVTYDQFPQDRGAKQYWSVASRRGPISTGLFCNLPS